MELMEGLIGNWMAKRGQITLFNIVVCYERNNTIQKKKKQHQIHQLNTWTYILLKIIYD